MPLIRIRPMMFLSTFVVLLIGGLFFYGVLAESALHCWLGVFLWIATLAVLILGP